MGPRVKPAGDMLLDLKKSHHRKYVASPPPSGERVRVRGALCSINQRDSTQII
jgi:hypothetical protein